MCLVIIQFCLMLAARGPEYSRDNVVATKQMTQYHDNCRCLGWEARGRTLEERWASLPPINRQLHDMWQSSIKTGISGDVAKEQRRKWRELIIFKRREATGSDEPVWFPPIKGLKLPKRSLKANHTAFGDVEPLPLVTTESAGHILFGWQRKQLGKLGKKEGNAGLLEHELSDRQGHMWDSQKNNKTLYPESWSQQDIVNAVHATIEDPDRVYREDDEKRHARKMIDGVLVQVVWSVEGNKAILNTAYPVRGKGVLRRKAGELTDPPECHNMDEYFAEVKG